MRKRNILTSNKEIYNKLSMLNFSSEVVLQNVKPIQVQKLLDNINKNDVILHSEQIGEYILVKKVGQLNYNIYLR